MGCWGREAGHVGGGAAARGINRTLKSSGALLGSLGFVLRANGQESRNCKQEGKNQTCFCKSSLTGVWRTRWWEAGSQGRGSCSSPGDKDVARPHLLRSGGR